MQFYNKAINVDRRWRLKIVAMLTSLIVLALPPAALAQNPSRTPLDYEFTYSVIDTEGDIEPVVEALRGQVLAAMRLSGARPYALWTPAEKPDSAPFAGLADNQVIFMLAWPRATDELLPSLQIVLESTPGVTSLTTKVFTPVYLSDGLNVPTGPGFYVHRDEHYAVENVDQAVTLSREAWVTWEPAWGTRVIGLFREKPDADGIARLNRIAWYADFPDWQRTRNGEVDPASSSRFAQRRQILIEGSGVAVASDRTAFE